MFDKVTKILSLCLFIILLGCARTPVALDVDEINSSIATDREALSVDASLQNIDLHTAIAIAVKNNRDLRISVMESALAQRQNELQRFDMLPDIALNAGYSEFTELQPSTSLGVDNDMGDSQGLDGTQSYTISRDKRLETRNIEFTWNALDFGLSYIRAGQQADRFLIAKELERKAIQNITRDIIRSYWKAQASENLLNKLSPLLERVDTALADSQYIEELLISSPMDSLLYQKELLDVQRTLQTQQRALINSKNELATLMGLLPNQKFTLSDQDSYLTNIDMDIETMENIALVSRPELMESRYQKRITSKDARAAIIGLIPGIKFNATYGYSDNHLLLNQDTTEYGASIGGNLFDIFSIGAVSKSSKASKELIAERHLAIAMTVLSQVHLSNMNYDLAIEEYDTAQRYLDVAKRISKQVQNAQKVSRFGELEVIREEASLLVAELRRDLAFSEMQHSIGQIYASVGKDILPANHENLSVDDLSNNIEISLMEWGETYQAVVNLPLDQQDPQLLIISDPINTLQSSNKFKISGETFDITGPGKLRYEVTQQDGTELPRWLAFLTSDLSIVGNPPENVSGIKLSISVSNALVSASDDFTLNFIDEEKFLANESEKARRELIELYQQAQNKDETIEEEVDLIEEEVAVIEESNHESEELAEASETPSSQATLTSDITIDSTDLLSNLLDSVEQTMNEAENILSSSDILDNNVETENTNEIVEEEVVTESVENNLEEVASEVVTNEELINILPEKKLPLDDIDVSEFDAEANDAKKELDQMIASKKEEELLLEANNAIEDLNEIIDPSDESVSSGYLAQASEAATTTGQLIENTDAEHVYIKIGSYKRGNAAFSFMNYLYDIMGFDSRFLKYDINVDQIAKNDYSVIVGPVPKDDAISMLESLDTQLSSDNTSIVEAELICNEEVIMMCSI